MSNRKCSHEFKLEKCNSTEVGIELKMLTKSNRKILKAKRKKRKRKDRSAQKKERKATQTLAVVLGK